ncbi:MAG: hypothetical protein JWN14_1930 [Chthonomonadales bacterium]|nr:hypothetical protein [Chthonomonadales bacterium]
MNDVILNWNAVALEANRISHTDGSKEQNGPTLSSRALAIVHLAMYDAYAGAAAIPAALPPYLAGLPAVPAGATRLAAAAGAAYETLVNLFPSQRDAFDQALIAIGDVDNIGHNYGRQVGQAILLDRKDDPSASAGTYRPKMLRGKHRVDPDNPGQGFHGPSYGAKSKGFAITARHALAAPPLDNPDYKTALDQVFAKGIAPELMGTLPAALASSRRTPEETLIGIYWGYDGTSGLGTPPRFYNQILRKIAIGKGNTEEQNARLFAFANVAMGDAGILAWDQKYIHEFWRPVVGIREHDKSIGPEATETHSHLVIDCDPFWLPLGAPMSSGLGAGNRPSQATFPFPQSTAGTVKNVTPPFPAYPSGHATFGAAIFHITRLFYGVPAGNHAPDNVLLDSNNQLLDFVSDELNGVTQDNKGTVRPRHRREFANGLWQMILENGLSRIFLGVHWSFDAFGVKADGTPDVTVNLGGVPLGLKIAEDIFSAGSGKAPKKSTVPPRP